MERDKCADTAGGTLRGGLQDQILGSHEVRIRQGSQTQRLGYLGWPIGALV